MEEDKPAAEDTETDQRNRANAEAADKDDDGQPASHHGPRRDDGAQQLPGP